MTLPTLPKNVLGGPLRACCTEPITGFYRTGFCEIGPEDIGVHAVCILITDEFLKFSKAARNDLSTPHPDYNFPGLRTGDKWCLCASRWVDAYELGMAPKIILSATHEGMLDYVPLEILQQFAIDYPATTKTN